MKKTILLSCIGLLLSACNKKPVVSEENMGANQNMPVIDKNNTFTVAIQGRYEMKFSDESIAIFESDGVLERGEVYTHTKNHINSNGIQSTIEGYYDGSRLYNIFNDIPYYEDMSMEELKSSMLVKMEFLKFLPDEVESTQEHGKTLKIVLNKEAAKTHFLNHYDFYGFDQYENINVVENLIVQSYDASGRPETEKVNYVIDANVAGKDARITFSSSIHYLKYNQTEVIVSDDIKKEWNSYERFLDIDSSKIQNSFEDSDDRGVTGLETFQKRLQSRLNYQVNEYGQYETKFNDGESYTIDFNHTTFVYRNRSSEYVYNWVEDFGGFGSSCNFNFKTETASSDCRDTVLETIQQVKLYFEMELYYCGLSIEELE